MSCYLESSGMQVMFFLILLTGIVALLEPVHSRIRQFLIVQLKWGFRKKKEAYHALFITRLRFYNRLNEEEQHKFLLRTFVFEHSKQFHFIDLTETAEKTALISAVAVQLTFGLKKFKLNYFRNIFILKEDYHYSHYSSPLEGHVDQTGIYLSWDRFIKGLDGITRNSNIGLHEMGHALTYVNFITQSEKDPHFHKEFEQFTSIARPVFEMLESRKHTVFSDYARTNYQEFWANCVELFFENPLRLRHEFPQLYASMKRLLRQDPLVILNEERLAA